VTLHVGALLAQRAAEGPVGRERELALLDRLTDQDDETLVVHVHGVAGVGKSVVLDAFLAAERARGTIVVRVDCRAVEPTERGFLHEVSSAVGIASTSLAEVTSRLAAVGDRILIALDNYEVFRLLDSWLRTTFVPALQESARVVLVGRDPPVPAWSISPEWEGLFRSLTVWPLEDAAALELLSAHGVNGAVGERVNRIARGHPLALRLAVAAIRERPDLSLEDAATQSVVAELTGLFLADVRDPVTREALDAASVVRRTTQSLLRVMLPTVAPQDAVEKLRALPFVETGHDGLMLHQAVQQAISAALRSADPERYRTLRRAAWRQLREEAADASTPDHWRYTADSLYLIENPVCREAFFPTGAQLLTVEPATRRHEPAVRALARSLEPPGAAAQLQVWWDETPDSFSVVLDRDGDVVGFSLMFEPTNVRRAVLLGDPVTAQWWRHLREHPVPRGDRVLFLRRWLGVDGGEGPSPVQAACWLDIKRTYMALRPDLRRVYTGVRNIEVFGPIVSQLRFQPVEAAGVQIDDAVFHSAVLDFGPASVDGWLADLAAAELGVQDVLTLDRDAGEVVLDGEHVALTPLEFGVLKHLHAKRGKVVSRSTVLRDVWGHDDTGGSNVVDSVVRSLRKKLGTQASSIETVRGFGYRCQL
jgi:Transcriptional regulatory protein, C terminal/AAA ATPase domain